MYRRFLEYDFFCQNVTEIVQFIYLSRYMVYTILTNRIEKLFNVLD